MKSPVTVLLASALLTPLSAISATPPGSAIVFVNGINNTFDDAVANLQIVKKQLNARDKNNAYVYGNAYNATQGFFTDVKSVFKQKAREGSSPADFWRAIDGGSLPASGMNAELQKKYIAILARSDVPELPDHLRKYRGYLNDKRKVVLIGHSQGSLYANFEINLLVTGPDKAQGAISAVNVGSATRYQLPGSSYLTSSSDGVIGALRLVQTVLPENFSMGWHPLSDVMGHSFSKIYMNKSYGAANQILQKVSQQAYNGK
ncbi:MAG: hypothetical protein EPN59_05700 [Paraburkholderia sp.]|uniref:hypothetical protein n=2 Tax=Paraburkholderia sp. TaxID=1926495 RepID=UPI00121C6E63|nr:hypothetical protein [Paraburkholderia sp.]TAM31181.1 MAG: hypothetical protein EPN59_05700 [Paraburkholderia sp.]